MVFLLTRTTRRWQRWRDGEGDFGLCLRRDVAAINKMLLCCERYLAAATPHKNKSKRRSRPNKHCLALPVSARTSGRCRAQASGRCSGMQVYPRQGVAVRTGAAMPLLHLAAGGDGGVSGKAPPHISREATTTRQDIDRHDHAAKSEGAANQQPRFAAPRRRRWMLTLTCVTGFTRRAQDITASYAGVSRTMWLYPLRIRRRYVGCRHTQQPAQPTTPYTPLHEPCAISPPLTSSLRTASA